LTAQTLLDRKGTAVHDIQPAASIADAARLLSDHDIGALVVTNADGVTVGIISERDIVRVLSVHGRAALETPVAEVMTRKVMTCSRKEKVVDIMRRMTEGRLRHLPVVEENKVVGVVSIRDIVELRLEQIERDADALREYIHSTSRSRSHDTVQDRAHLEQARFPRVF
jgi:CBS domain-containing protein